MFKTLTTNQMSKNRQTNDMLNQ